jgi:hypothetical protein
MKSFAPPLSETHALKCELAGEVLRSCGQLRLQVTGWSMLPSVWPGDTLIIEKANFDEVAEGEIVLIGRERRLMAHRVISCDSCGRDGVVTRGDAMAVPDRPAAGEEVLGRVSLIERNGRQLAPSAKLRTWQRLVAALVSRSEFAARVVVKSHELYSADRCSERSRAEDRRASRRSTHRPQTSSDRVVPCQS